MEPDSAEVKQRLEALAGQPERLKLFWFPTSAYDYTPDGFVAWQNFILPGLRCYGGNNLLDASGATATGAEGKRVFLLSDFVCLPQHRLLAEPVNVLATARSTSPFILTTTHSLINPSDLLRSDVEITVFSWDANGAAAPNVSFDWRCRVHSVSIIL